MNVVIDAADKVYDGSLHANGSVTGITGVLSGDDVISGGTASFSFADRNVGHHKAVSVSGMALGGLDAANYEIGTLAPARRRSRRWR